MSGPLDGLKVLDCTIVLAGPYASLLLADLGADVIKIENANPTGKPQAEQGVNAPLKDNNPMTGVGYMVANRNKRGLAIDLKTDNGKEILYKLVKTADILVQNFRPGVMDRLGFGWSKLHELNPRLIYCSISGFGQGSPYAEQGGFDLIAQGMSGLMSLTGLEDSSEPIKTGVPICDVGTAMYGVIGILSAIRERDRNGRGQHVDVSLLDTPISWLTWRAGEYWDTGESAGPQGSGQAMYRSFLCSDEKWVNIGPSEKLWRKVCEVMNRPDLVEDERFKDNKSRKENHLKLTELFQQQFLKRSSTEWIDLFQTAGVPVGPINNVADILDNHPHVTAKEMVVELDHPTLGKVKSLGVPIKFSETPGSVDRAAPLLGQHTWPILLKLGYTIEEIEKFVADKIIAIDENVKHGG